jgi:hypothetical protein
MAKLKQDEIKTIYTLEATEAQQELQKLKSTNKELSRTMDARRKEMVKLEAQGKKNTAEYKNLEKATREDSKTLRDNTKLIRQQEEAMGVNSLTMNQLRQRAKSLRGELNNISKELSPERWSEVNKKLSETTGRMNDLRMNASQLNKNLGASIFSRNTFASFWGNLYAQLALKIGQSLHKVREFISESTRLASQAQGIDHAFNRIANRDYLKSLRDQTKGLISDFTLMQSSVRAENFNIPLNQLGKMLEFAQNRARDTGESVDYLVESIVNGIGRKSPLILDNLGISTVRLQEEVKKTGDFAAAVGKIIDEEMAKAGPSIDTATDAATRKKVAWENLMLVTGKFFTGFKTGWDNFMTNFLEGVTKIISKGDDAKKTYDDQINKVAELNNSLVPLIDRYEKLKIITSLSVEEQTELRNVIAKINDIVPAAATEWDEYGKAIALNTQLVWDFIDAETAKLEYMNRDAISEETKNLQRYKDELELVIQTREKGTKKRYRWGTEEDVALSPDELKALDSRRAELNKIVLGAETYLNEITGKSAKERVKLRQEELNKEVEFNQMSIDELDSYIKKYSDKSDMFIEIARRVYKSRVNDGSEYEENNGGKSKYDKEIAELEAYISKEKALIQQKYIDGKINKEQYDRELEYLEQEKLRKTLEISGISFEQQMEIELKLLEKKKETLQKIQDMEKDHLDKLLELQQQAEQERIDRNLGTLKAVAEQNQKNWEEEFEKEKERRLKDLEISQEFGMEMGNLVGGFIADNDDMMKAAAKNIVMMGLDLLETQVQMAVAQAAGWSFAQPDSIMTLGAAGAARAVLMAGLIKGAFTAVKSFISSKWGGSTETKDSPTSGQPTPTGKYIVTGREDGGFIDVTREQDKKRYIAKFDPMRRGFVNRPTVIVGEGPAGKSAEWVASNDALKNPTIAPFIKLLDESQKAGTIRTIDLNHIMRGRMAGFESGGFISPPPQASPTPSPAPGQSTPAGMSNEELQIMKEVRDLLSTLNSKGVKAPIVLSEFERKRELLDNSRNIGRK